MSVKVAFPSGDTMDSREYPDVTGWTTEYGNLHLLDSEGNIKITYAHGCWHHLAGLNGASGKLSESAPKPPQGGFQRRGGGTPGKGKAMDDAARAAWPDESQFPTCNVHGDTMSARSKPERNHGKPWLTCWKKNDDGSYCESAVWSLPPAVAAAIVAAS